MRILYVADTSSWHNALWTRFFVQRHDCKIFSDLKKDYNPVRFDERLERVDFPPLLDTGNRHLNKATSVPVYLWHLWRFCARWRPDIVHAVAMYYGLLGVFAARFARAPFVYTLQGSEVLIRAKSSRLYRQTLRFIWRHADLVTGDSHNIIEAAVALGLDETKSHLVQNGVDLATFVPQEAGEPRILPGGRDVSGMTVICSPRALTPLYNIDRILAAFSELTRKDPGALLVLAYAFGDEYLPNLRDRAEALGIAERCLWLGYLEYEDMARLYQASDVVVSVPSSDSSPKSVYEAAACGCRVVVSELPWVGEYFGPANAVIVAPDDPVGLADAVASAIAEIEASDDARVVRGLECVQSHFSFQDNMARMEALMVSAVEHASASD